MEKTTQDAVCRFRLPSAVLRRLDQSAEEWGFDGRSEMMRAVVDALIATDPKKTRVLRVPKLDARQRSIMAA